MRAQILQPGPSPPKFAYGKLRVTKNDRGCSQHRAADKEREIGQKQGQQHQGETAKHRCPIFHPFPVGEDDEAEGAENNAGDTVHCEHVGHMPFL